MIDFTPTSIPKATQTKNRQLRFKARVARKGTDESTLNYSELSHPMEIHT